MASIDDVRRLVELDHGLASLVTTRPDGTAQVTVVNAGVVDHPRSGEPVAAFVARPGTHKVANLRSTPLASLNWRAGWAWCTVEGEVDLAGPDDDLGDGVDVPALLRAVYSATGAHHEDWAEYDRVMAAEGRLAVLVRPRRVYVNP